MLELLRDIGEDSVRLQQNVAKEFTRIEGLLPAGRVTATYVTADYLVKPTDVLVFCTPSAAMNLTLPPAGPLVGQTFTVKNNSKPGTTVHIRGSFINGASQTVDGVAPFDISTGVAVRLYSTGTAWEVV